MKKLLVGSVFINDSPMQCQWLDLQLKFLTETVGDFEYTAIIWKQETDHFNKVRCFQLPCPYRDSDAHAYGYTCLLNYYRQHIEEFEYFLLLDSDAFPIKKNWISVLTQAMGNCEIAAPIRAEDMELRLHPAVVFIKDKTALSKLDFLNGPVGADLLGNLEQDHFLPHYQHKEKHLAFPLMRSNGYNVHSLACAIYYDMFYHHSCGAGHGFMSRKDGYWLNAGKAHEANMWQFTRELMTDPEGFIGKLRGKYDELQKLQKLN